MSHDLQFSVEGAPPPNTNSDQAAAASAFAGTSFEQDHNGNAAAARITTPPQQQPQTTTGLSQSAHPMACIFHILFKIAALALYIFGGWFVASDSSANFITLTVICILLLAADFWVVKNITGRLLVGLRWWNKVDGETTRWIFESSENSNMNKYDNTVFWTVLYMTPLVWFALFIIGILKLELGWLITVCMAISLSVANVYGYYKCSSDQKAKFRRMMQRGAEQGAMAMIRNNMFGMLIGGSGGGGATTQANTQATYV